MDEEKQQPKSGNIVALVCLHIVAIGYVIYLFYTNLRNYLAGGEAAPSLATVILSGVILLGGAVLVGIFTWRLYRQHKKSS